MNEKPLLERGMVHHIRRPLERRLCQSYLARNKDSDLTKKKTGVQEGTSPLTHEWQLLCMNYIHSCKLLAIWIRCFSIICFFFSFYKHGSHWLISPTPLLSSLLHLLPFSLKVSKTLFISWIILNYNFKITLKQEDARKLNNSTQNSDALQIWRQWTVTLNNWLALDFHTSYFQMYS